MTSASLRIEELKEQHAKLEDALNAESSKPLPDETAVATIKKQKLRIKDEIARLQHA